jgi:N-methylhydantoinase B/oxoprolinase/acetone carboxylase alpha subunit
VQEVAGLQSPSKFANVQLRAGDVLVSIQGGGGGFGDPDERPATAVQEDLRLGYVTEEGLARPPRGTARARGPRDDHKDPP